MLNAWKLRLATIADVPYLEPLIQLSAKTLQAQYYSQQQIEAAFGPVFGVDRQLIGDQTYYVVESEKSIVACGGWSKRKALFGGDAHRSECSNFLDPKIDPARIRAFFVHPNFARKGLGKLLLLHCEEAIREAGFTQIELVATLPGIPLYLKFGYEILNRYEIPLQNNFNLPVAAMRKIRS